MTVVLDTNVVVSGIFWSGPPYKILQAWHSGKFKLATSLEIIEEYRRVGQELGRKFPQVDITSILDLLVYNSDIFATANPPTPICSDPDDDKFLMCAVASNSKYLVTGDAALLELDGYEGIKILKPGPFSKIIGG